VTANYEVREHDVLIIGAGGAGLRAAIEALAQGASVGVVCKSLLGKAHTVMAEGGIAAAMANVDAADNWKAHFRDTMRGGKLLNNWRMAQLHAQEAPDRVRELEQWGALFDRTESGAILQRAFGGHTFKRLCHVGDRTGLELIRTLQDRGVQQGVDCYMECTVTRLLVENGRFAGAFAYWRENGRFIVFKAKAVVIATGGIGKAWTVTSNSWEYTGDGMALAYEAGAELMDMEFVQFHPTGMVWPPGVQGILVTEAVRGEGGILRNKLGERFMEKYDPKRMELSTRDVVARSIYTEVREGRGTEHGGAFLDISQKPAEYVKKKLPSMYHQFKELADVDITKEPMEVEYAWKRRPDSLPFPEFTRRVKPRRGYTARIDWAEIRFRIYWYLDAAPDWRPRRTPSKLPTDHSTTRSCRKLKKNCLSPLPTPEKVPTPSIAICRQ
jgi:succinate dehydrogenase / fumarate reductase flavoprotein subunit